MKLDAAESSRRKKQGKIPDVMDFRRHDSSSEEQAAAGGGGGGYSLIKAMGHLVRDCNKACVIS